MIFLQYSAFLDYSILNIYSHICNILVTKSNNFVKTLCVFGKILGVNIYSDWGNERKNHTFIYNIFLINTVVFLSKSYEYTMCIHDNSNIYGRIHNIHANSF